MMAPCFECDTSATDAPCTACAREHAGRVRLNRWLSLREAQAALDDGWRQCELFTANDF